MILSDVELHVPTGTLAALVGPNGAGKSTLLAVLAGKLTADSGELSCRRGLRIGYLEQIPQLPLDARVEDAVLTGLADRHDGLALALAGEILSKLELSAMTDAKVETLSGGWRKRVALARELVRDPDLLLLDEPTNHLDVESILWLEDFLARAAIATVTVTHDRLFLQRVATRILELDRRNPQGLLSVQGDYATYLDRKAELLDLQQTHERKLGNTLRRETEWLRRGPKARTTKQQARINAAETLREEVEELHARNQSRTARLDFSSTERRPKRLLEGKQLGRSQGGRPLFRGLDLFLGPGDRIGLLGNNGCGKSTLIRVLLGEEAPDEGTVLRSEHLRVAYFQQSREALDPSLTLRLTLCPHGDRVNYRGQLVHVHGYLDRFLFRKDQADLPVGQLSGGEQSRVLIAGLMLREANVLVLDEPTNDLDVETLDVLQECLTGFEGAVILVTHDRYFLDHVATEIRAFDPTGEGKGAVVTFADLAQWEAWRKERQRQERPTAGPSPRPIAVPAPAKKKLGYKETRELGSMESRIHEAELRLRKLEAEAAMPENQSNAHKLSELYRAIGQNQEEIERLYSRWAELEREA